MTKSLTLAPYLNVISSSMAGPSITRRISGSVPGFLDPSQPERLFRLPDSTLQFASFDPLAATARCNGFSIGGESYRPKRIVIEVTPGGDSSWRYVPNALLDDGVEDEGEWPRQVEICGDVVECSQDQWDIYKLDPLYECRVRILPYLAQITKATDTKTAVEALERKQPTSTSPTEGPSHLGRQRTRACPNPKGHCQTRHADVGDDMMDVEAMDVDESPPAKDGKETGFPKTYRVRRNILENNGGRRCHGETSDGGDVENFPNVFIGNSQNHKKRKLADIPESPLTLDGFSRARTKEQHFTTYPTMQKGKRTRTASPTFARQELKSNLLRRKKSKRQRREQDFLVKQQKREENLSRDLMADAAQQMHDNARGDAQGDAKNGVEVEFMQSEED